VARLCVEQGIVPVVVAVGSKAPGFAQLLEPEIASLAERFLVDSYTIIDQADFGDIERLSLEYGANLMIGSSEGRRIEAKHAIPLVRCAFPIHDHIGGQRVRTIGYEGALTLMDRLTNSLIQRKHTGFRAAIREEFYDGTALADLGQGDGSRVPHGTREPSPCPKSSPRYTEPVPLTIEQRTAQHPCFNGGCASENARIHLPVAPKCNISCNYCVRKFDCVNESRPGVTSRVLNPAEALERFKTARQKVARLTTVGIAGPGDALANWDATRQTLELIRAEDSQVTFCLSTNGLMLPRYADELAGLGVTHVTVTVNAIDTGIGGKIYRFARMGSISYEGDAAAAVLLSNQVEGIRRLVELGVVVKVNTVLIAGVNDTHVSEVSKFMAGLGVSVHNIMQMVPVAGAVFGDLPQVSRHVLDSAREQCATYLPQMSHCQQCRADAVGKLAEDLLPLLEASEGKRVVQPPRDSTKVITALPPTLPSPSVPVPALPRLRVAIASRSGMMVDTHFGHAKDFLIYEVDDLSLRFVQRRNTDTYCRGNDYCADGEQENRLSKTIATVKDCKAVVSLRIGAAPSAKLKEQGILALTSCDSIEDAVRAARATLIGALERETARQAAFEGEAFEWRAFEKEIPELKEVMLI
jgi:nitrogenase cofactor biosynthesis protein NifB